MSTVEMTPEKNNGPQRLTKGQRRLERLFEMAGKHALASKKNYSHYRDVLDFMQDDAVTHGDGAIGLLSGMLLVCF